MQREALEGANTNTAVLTTMNDAAKALKKANNELDVDKVAIVAVIVNRFLFIHRCATWWTTSQSSRMLRRRFQKLFQIP